MRLSWVRVCTSKLAVTWLSGVPRSSGRAVSPPTLSGMQAAGCREWVGGWISVVARLESPGPDEEGECKGR